MGLHRVETIKQFSTYFIQINFSPLCEVCQVFYFFWIVALKGILKATFPFWYFLVGRKKYNKLLYPTMFWICFISSSRFCVDSLGFLYIVLHHAHIITILPVPIQFGWFLLIFLVWLLWLVLLICWREVMRMGFFFLFQILAELLSTFHHWILYWL